MLPHLPLHLHLLLPPLATPLLLLLLPHYRLLLSPEHPDRPPLETNPPLLLLWLLLVTRLMSWLPSHLHHHHCYHWVLAEVLQETADHLHLRYILQCPAQTLLARRARLHQPGSRHWGLRARPAHGPVMWMVSREG
jgi:hypothetical protein